MAHAGSHPRKMLHLWQQLLNKFVVIPSQIEYRFCLSFVPTGLRNRIYDLQSAEDWLQLEDDSWTRENADPARDQGGGNKSDRKFLSWAFGPLWRMKETAGVNEKIKKEDIGKDVQSAIGFWLFPIEVLDAKDFPYSAYDMFDMSAYWPCQAFLRSAMYHLPFVSSGPLVQYWPNSKITSYVQHNCTSTKHRNLEDQIIYDSMNSSNCQYFPGANNY
jgi:hypothetical protein